MICSPTCASCGPAPPAAQSPAGWKSRPLPICFFARFSKSPVEMPAPERSSAAFLAMGFCGRSRRAPSTNRISPSDSQDLSGYAHARSEDFDRPTDGDSRSSAEVCPSMSSRIVTLPILHQDADPINSICPRSCPLMSRRLDSILITAVAFSYPATERHALSEVTARSWILADELIRGWHVKRQTRTTNRHQIRTQGSARSRQTRARPHSTCYLQS